MSTNLHPREGNRRDPVTRSEARLVNHQLKEEKKLLLTTYDNTEKTAQKYKNLAFCLHHKNLHLQEKLETLSLELKGTTLRYEEARSLSQTRLKRLLAARLFVTSEADSHSTSELIQKVESLDDDVEASNNTADPAAKANIQDGADPRPNLFSDKSATASSTSEVGTNSLPEAGNHFDSKATLINPVSRDGAGYDSDVVGGIANSGAMHPTAAMEARLEKENDKLKEENELLRSKCSSLETATRKYQSDTRRFCDENELLQKTIEALTLEVNEITKRYEEAKSLGESRLKRLLAAQVFLTLAEGAGSPSLSDLVQRVDALNGGEYLKVDGLPISELIQKVDKLKEENNYLRKEFSTVQSGGRKYHHDAFRFHHEKERLQETLEAMSLEIKGVTKRYEEAKSLSDARGRELIGAQVFLTKADGLSISELIQKVDGLNDEIYQAAASLGESIVQKNVNPSEQIPYSSDEGATAKALLGSPLCKILQSRARKTEEGINPLLVQIALQSFFSVFCEQRIQSWDPSNPAFDRLLQEFYQKTWSSGDQAVSGRWRSLTRALLRPETNGWIKELMTDLDAILALASWEIGSPEDRHTLEARLPAIFKVVLDIREAIGEKLTSADIEVTYVESNTPFNDIYMEETYAADSKGHKKDPEIVIATVGIGVRKVVIMMKEGWGYEYVLSPKVVLESSLRAALEPPLPPLPTRAKSTRWWKVT